MSRLPTPLARFAWRSWAALAAARVGREGPRALLPAGAQASLALVNAALAHLDEPGAATFGPPILIVGHQRSGTTFLHRLLARHPDAGTVPLHGLLLPSDAAQRALGRVRRPAWFDRAQDRVFGPLDPLHRLRLHEVEEDEFLLWALHRSPMNALDRPWPPTGPPSIGPDAVGLAVYADAVGRASRRLQRRYVGKNPHFTAHLDAVRGALPGVRVVQLLRHPAAAVASRLSLLRAIWRARIPTFGELLPHHVEGLVANSVACLRGGLVGADLDLTYDELVADPAATVQRVHAELGLAPWSTSSLDELRAAATTGELRSNARTGRFPLEHFGLTAEGLRERLADVYAVRGWR